MVHEYALKCHSRLMSISTHFQVSTPRPIYSRFISVLSIVLVISMPWNNVLPVEAAPGASPDRIRINCATPLGLLKAARLSEHNQTALKEEWLPEGKLFRPLLADMKQPRFYASYRHVRFRERGLVGERRGDSIFTGLVGYGMDFGLWALRQANGCDGIQVDLSTAVFSQFNMDTASNDLINTDFFVGPSLTFRRGPLSSQLRLFHQSSHLGDEFLLNNPGVDRVELSTEGIDLLLSIEKQMWRLYGGGGYLLHTKPDLKRGMLKLGLELYGLRWLRRTKKAHWMPIFGANFSALEEQNWSTTTSIKGGIEVTNLSETRHFRFLIVYLRGFIPFGQFFNTATIENYGIELQFDP